MSIIILSRAISFHSRGTGLAETRSLCARWVKDSFKMMPSGTIQILPQSNQMASSVPQMMFCLPQMAPPPGDEHSKVPGYRPGMEKPLTTSAIPIYKLPKCRLTECIEFLCDAIDCTLTADLDQLLLSIIVWQLTGVKPDLQITEFHARSYLDLYLRLRRAHERMKCTGQFEKSTQRNLHRRKGKCWIM